MTRLRVLIVSPTLPYPPSWGFGMRVYQLARYLSERHDVTLLSYARADEMVHVDSLRELLTDVRAVERPQSRGLTKRLAQLTSIASTASYQVRDLHTVEMQSAIDELLSSQPFDIIQVESARCVASGTNRAPPSFPIEHNIEYELLQRMQQGERSWTRRLHNRVEYRKFARSNRGFWRKADGCVMTSERGSDRSGSRPVDASDGCFKRGGPRLFHTKRIDTQADTLVFNGLPVYRPNFDAASYFVDDVLPRIERIRPGVTLTLVGHGHAAGARNPEEAQRGPDGA